MDCEKIERVSVRAYRIPTDYPESDGTLEWDSTDLVVVWLRAGSQVGMGYTYGHKAIAGLIHDKLGPAAEGRNAMDVNGLWDTLIASVRNLGRPGMAAMAIAAMDVAAWDLKARLLNQPLAGLLGRCRDAIDVYGSGGFTSYPVDRLQKQLAHWAESGLSRVKMKIGRNPETDQARVAAAREAIGTGCQLFVDANGAYDRKQAAAMAQGFVRHGVSWYEEPVSSDDMEGLRLLRRLVPTGMEVTAGEYGYDARYFRRMLDADAVDVIQPDVTRCCGITEYLRIGALCSAASVPLSAHTAPALHMHVCCALPAARHVEYFHDHVRIENHLFDGVVSPQAGVLAPDMTRPGHGLEFKETEADRYRV